MKHKLKCFNCGKTFKPENDKIVTIGQALMRYYFAIYETIEAEEAVMGEGEN